MFQLLSRRSCLFIYTKVCACHICSPSRSVSLCSPAAGSLADIGPGEVLHRKALRGAPKTPAFPSPFMLSPPRSHGTASIMGIREGRGQQRSPRKPSVLWPPCAVWQLPFAFTISAPSWSLPYVLRGAVAPGVCSSHPASSRVAVISLIPPSLPEIRPQTKACL